MKREVTLRLEESEFLEFDDVCHTRRVKKQAALLEALRVWLGAPPAAPSPPAGLAKEDAHQVSQFLDFMRNGDEGAVEMVRHALELHARKQRASRKQQFGLIQGGRPQMDLSATSNAD